MPYENSPADYYVGKGKLWVDLLDSDDARTGERYLGNAPTFEITTNQEKLDHRSSADAAAAKDASLVKSTDVSIRIVLDEYSKENVALAVAGDHSTLTQTSGSASDEAVTAVAQDRWYELAYRDVSSVVVTGSEGTPTYVVDEDYKVDAVSGRLYIVAGGDITAGTELEVSYDYGELALDTTRAVTDTDKTAFLRFVSDPSEGKAKEIQIWKVVLRSDGALPLITEDWGQITLAGEVESDTANHPNEPHMRIIDLE